jgi:hypothetical protein
MELFQASDLMRRRKIMVSITMSSKKASLKYDSLHVYRIHSVQQMKKAYEHKPRSHLVVD